MDVLICDVGPRDGLQNEATTLAPGLRAMLVDRLAACGVARIEAASFVSPRAVPQMAGAEEVMAAIHPRPGVAYAGLVLNERGYDRALAAGVRVVNYALPVTDTFATRNQGTTVAEGVVTARRLAGRARADGVRLTVTLSCALGCPFEGPVSPARVLGVLEDVGPDLPDEWSIADTIGAGVPREVRALVAGALEAGARTVGAHLHDTRNTGIANALAALEAGATVLDASVGGTGGCPFAPRATGNVASEDLVNVLERTGVATGIDLDALIEVGHWLGERLGKELPSLVGRAGIFRAQAEPSG